MKHLVSILFFFGTVSLFGQAPVSISGKIVDENKKSIQGVMLTFCNDTAYTDKDGRFQVVYKDQERYRYYLHLTREGYFPKSYSVEIKPGPIVLNTPIRIRSRAGFSYNSRQIDKTHIGVTVRELIEKYKLDTTECRMVHEPPGIMRGFTTELSDSAYVFVTIERTTNYDRKKIFSFLNLVVIGIAVAWPDGSARYYGKGFLWNGGIDNPYFVEKLIQEMDKQK
jgi:hypothetical protein